MRLGRLDAGHNCDNEDKSEAVIKHCSLGILGAIVEPEEALNNRDVKKCVDDILNQQLGIIKLSCAPHPAPEEQRGGEYLHNL